MTFRAPYLTHPEIWEKADAFRDQWWRDGGIPVDILAVAEFDLGLEIRPVEGLKSKHDIDALVVANWTTLIIDRAQYMSERIESRMRFSIAHEIGHIVLHKEIVQVPETEDGLCNYIESIPEKQYAYLEFHANEFAGRLLVPSTELNALIDEQRAKVNAMPKTQQNLAWDYALEAIAKRFNVSTAVIDRRIISEKIIL